MYTRSKIKVNQVKIKWIIIGHLFYLIIYDWSIESKTMKCQLTLSLALTPTVNIFMHIPCNIQSVPKKLFIRSTYIEKGANVLYFYMIRYFPASKIQVKKDICYKNVNQLKIRLFFKKQEKNITDNC